MDWKTRSMMRDIELVLGCVAAAGTAYVTMRIVLGPSAMAMAKMKIFRTMEGVCMDNAKLWADMADGAAGMYDKARAVVL